MADLQRIDLKVFLDAPDGASYDPILTTFDRWRKETDAPQDWVDLADYAHMKQGPAVMMAGKRDNFLVDTNEPGPGVVVQTRKDLSGSLEDRFSEAFRRHFELAQRLTSEAEWPSGLSVRGGDWQIAINDRLGFPNNDATDAELRSAVTAVLDKLFPDGYNLERESNPQSRFGYRVTAEGNPTLQSLSESL